MIKLTKEMIDLAFDGAKHQTEWLLALYKIAIPQWDRIERCDGWPRVSETTWKYICEKAMTFDQLYHRDVMPGGMWLNSGFGQSPIADWLIDTASVALVLKREGVEVANG